MNIGDTVYLKTQGNLARHGVAIYKSKISKIGRQYFYVEGFSKRKFKIDTMKEVGDGNSYYSISFSLEDFNNEREYGLIETKIVSELHWSNKRKFTIEQMRKVAEILDLKIEFEKYKAEEII